MATATLIIGEPQEVTLEAVATDLREVVIPSGVRSLLIDCEEPIFVEVDTGQADAGAGTAGEQHRFPAGLHSWRVPGTGGGRSRSLHDISLFIAATSASQKVDLTAQREG